MGVSYREVDDMLLPEVWDLLRYWKSYPPVHMQGLPFFRHYTGTEVEREPNSPQQPSSSPSPANQQEAAALHRLAGETKSFDQLPLSIQARLRAAKEFHG